MSTVTVLPQNISFEIDGETSLFSALEKQNIYVRSDCGGFAVCSQCVVKIEKGSDCVNRPEFKEIGLLGNIFHITKERLSCQTYVFGDITIDVSHQSNEIIPKSRPSTKLRKKEEVKEKQKKNLVEKVENQAARVEKENRWFKHWEKDQNTEEKTKGGNRRPNIKKAFKKR